jgi:signal transduction histidine kinase
MTLSALLLLGGTLVIAPAGAPGFVPVTYLTFATVVAGILAYRARWALVLIAVTTILVWEIDRSAPPAAFMSADGFDARMSMLLCSIGGIGILVTKVEFVRLWRRSEARAQREARLNARTRRESERLQMRALAERRIHETVLNTLSAISMGVGVDEPDAIRAACRSDLDHLDRIPRPLSTWTGTAAVVAAVEAAETAGLRCTVSGESHEALEPFTAWALRDAIAESLTNILRHAGVDEAELRVSGGAMTLVTISDKGRGVDATHPQGFGISTSIRSAIRNVGGTATLNSELGRGTVVTLTVPHGTHLEVIPPVERDLTASSSLPARLGLLGSLMVFVLGTAFLTTATQISVRVCVASALALGINIALASSWNTRGRIPLAAMALIAMACVFWATGTSSMTHQGGTIVLWTIGLAGGGGAILVLLAHHSSAARISVIGLVTICGILLVLQLPWSRTPDVLLPIFSNLVYLVSLWLVVRWGERHFLRRLEESRVSQRSSLARRLDAERTVAALDGWAMVDRRARRFLESISSGACDSGSAESQQSAAMLAGNIRSRITHGTRLTTTPSLVDSLERLQRAGSGELEIKIHSAIAFDVPLPVEVMAALRQICDDSSEDLISINLAETEEIQVLVVKSSSRVISLASDLINFANDASCQVALLEDPQDEAPACFIVERVVPHVVGSPKEEVLLAARPHSARP